MKQQSRVALTAQPGWWTRQASAAPLAPHTSLSLETHKEQAFGWIPFHHLLKEKGLLIDSIRFNISFDVVVYSLTRK